MDLSLQGSCNSVACDITNSLLPDLARAQFLNDWTAKLWSRFFCLSVYVTMYLNDHQRSAFYESLGLDTTQFNRCA